MVLEIGLPRLTLQVPRGFRLFWACDRVSASTRPPGPPAVVAMADFAPWASAFLIAVVSASAFGDGDIGVAYGFPGGGLINRRRALNAGDNPGRPILVM